jgi:hypothetical protein
VGIFSVAKFCTLNVRIGIRAVMTCGQSIPKIAYARAEKKTYKNGRKRRDLRAVTACERITGTADFSPASPCVNARYNAREHPRMT